MRRSDLFREPLIQRLIFLFLILGLIPTLLLAVAPTIYIMLHGTEFLGESLLLMWAAQGITFLIIVLVGASVSLRRLAIPIQELIKGARAIAEGNLSYRVALRNRDRELVALAQTFNEMAAAVETMRDNTEHQRAALQAALIEREREFEALLEIASLVNTPGDLPSTAQHALRIVREIQGMDIIILVVFDEDGQTATTVIECENCPYSRPKHGEPCARERQLRRVLRRMEDDLLRVVITTRELICIKDTHDEAAALSPDLREMLDAIHVRKLLLKPLVSRGRVVGVLIPMRHAVIEISERQKTLLHAQAENITVLIENRELQKRSRTLTIMEERRRLASDLHDSVTQSLFSLSLMARGLKSSLVDVPDGDRQVLEMLVEQTKVIQTEMRTLINELRPIDLEADDLESALRQHARSLQRTAATDVQLAIAGDVRGLPRAVQQHLNRIAQEALSNIARHASAARTEIRLEVTGQCATLTISDDGRGFDARAIALGRSDSLGLISMRERAEMLGGALLVRSVPGNGTAITVQVPLAVEIGVPADVS